MKNFFKRFSAYVLVCSLVFLCVGCNPSASKLKKVAKGLTNYKIDATFDDNEKKLTAVEIVDYVSDVDTILNSVVFNLYGCAFSDDAKIKPCQTSRQNECYPNGLNYGDLTISNVLVNLNSCDFKIGGADNNALEVNLIEPLYEGERVNITIEFCLNLANCTHRLGYMGDNVNLGNWYPVVAVYENGNFVTDPYFSNGDPFYSKCANYDVTITYPESYKLASTGSLQETSCSNGNRIDKYKAVCVRDFALCMSKNYSITSGQVGDTKVSVCCYENDENASIYLDTAIKTLELFSKIFGEYPYSEICVAFTKFYQGGMEYPELVFISDNLEQVDEIKKVIVHELAHQWWYGIVGNNEVNDAWFDEGLAEYSTLIYFEQYPDENISRESLMENALSSYKLYVDVIKSLDIKANFGMELSLNDYNSEYEYVEMIYVKGLIFFDELRQKLGDENFFKGLKYIFNQYSFKIIDKQGFIDAFNKVSKVDITEFVEEWFSGRVDSLTDK